MDKEQAVKNKKLNITLTYADPPIICQRKRLEGKSQKRGAYVHNEDDDKRSYISGITNRLFINANDLISFALYYFKTMSNEDILTFIFPYFVWISEKWEGKRITGLYSKKSVVEDWNSYVCMLKIQPLTIEIDGRLWEEYARKCKEIKDLFKQAYKKYEEVNNLKRDVNHNPIQINPLNQTSHMIMAILTFFMEWDVLYVRENKMPSYIPSIFKRQPIAKFKWEDADNFTDRKKRLDTFDEASTDEALMHKKAVLENFFPYRLVEGKLPTPKTVLQPRHIDWIKKSKEYCGFKRKQKNKI